MKQKDLSLIWKPTEACNLGCAYCYAGNNPVKHITDKDDIKKGISKWAKYVGDNRKLNIIFHGGEPMLCGFPYYKDIMGYVRELDPENKKISLSMQTNGTLLTEESIDYFVENGLDIGLSLDGTEGLNGLTRFYHDGNNSYSRIVRTITHLKERAGKAGIITVVSKANIDHLVDAYEHFREIGITGVSFNSLSISGRAKENDFLGITPEEWNGSMIGLFDHYWQYDRKNKNFTIRPFSDIIDRMLTGRPNICYTQKSCQDSFYGIDSKGDIYPCGRFCGDKGMVYGNLFTDDLEDIANHSLRKKLFCRSQCLEKECLECDYMEVCNGGCMHVAHDMVGDIMKRSPFCEKQLYGHVYHTLENALEKELEGIRHTQPH